VRDDDRGGGLVPPLPVPREPAAPLPKERVDEILADPRVILTRS